MEESVGQAKQEQERHASVLLLILVCDVKNASRVAILQLAKIVVNVRIMLAMVILVNVFLDDMVKDVGKVKIDFM